MTKKEKVILTDLLKQLWCDAVDGGCTTDIGMTLHEITDFFDIDISDADCSDAEID